MLIDWLDGHFIFFILFVGFSAVIKVVASFFYYGDAVDFSDVFFLLFKWYSTNELEITDEVWRVRFMKRLNFLSILFYFSLLILTGAYMLTKLF